MNERITLISLIDEKNQNKIMKYINLLDEDLCKVPYGKGVADKKR